MEKDKFTIEHLNVYYSDFHAIKDVTLHLPEHQISAFIGPSGCGNPLFLKLSIV